MRRKSLAPRQVETLALMIKGLSNQEIATELDIKVSTVKGYLGDCFLFLNVKSRSEIMYRYYTGELDPMVIEKVKEHLE